jgi:hypothetical protein
MSRQPCPRLVRPIAYTTFRPLGLWLSATARAVAARLDARLPPPPFRLTRHDGADSGPPATLVHAWSLCHVRCLSALRGRRPREPAGARIPLSHDAGPCHQPWRIDRLVSARRGRWRPTSHRSVSWCGAGLSRCAALLLTHFFGFAQAAAPIRALCDEHGIALIEDCSHALFDPRGGGELGRHGRYTTASPYKLFPCEDGGWLIPAPGAPLPGAENRRASLRAELKSLANAIERSVKRPRAEARMGAPDAIDAEIRQIVAAPIERGPHLRSESLAVSGLYRERRAGLCRLTCLALADRPVRHRSHRRAAPCQLPALARRRRADCPTAGRFSPSCPTAASPTCSRC